MKYLATAIIIIMGVTGAHARTVTVERSDQSYKNANARCNPATGNWKNAANITCPVQGSGPGDLTIIIKDDKE